MQWYYVINEKQQGPVDDGEFKRLIDSGVIHANTLIWNESMTDWQPLSKTVYAQGITAPAPVSVLTPPTGTVKAWRDKKHIVVLFDDPQLPKRCVVSNEPVSEGNLINRKLSYTKPLLLLAILINIIVFLILAMIFSKSIKLDIGLNDAALEARHKATVRFTVMLFVGIGLCVAAIAQENLIFLLLPAILLIILSLYKLSKTRSILSISKLDKVHVWLSGGNKAFLESLPEFKG